MPSGPRLVAYFGVMYYSALRPKEAVTLSKENLSLPPLVGINYYRQQAPPDQHLAKISRLKATGKPVAVTELGFVAARTTLFLSTINAAPLSMLGMAIPALRYLVRPRVRTVYQRDKQAQARLAQDQAPSPRGSATS